MPSGAKARARANIAAIDVLARLRQAGRLATVAEQRSLAAWSGWGAIPGVFDRRDESFTAERDQVRELLTREQYDHAQASVLNAHYTDPALAQTIWQALQRAGFTGGRVLELGFMRNFCVSRDIHAIPKAIVIRSHRRLTVEVIVPCRQDREFHGPPSKPQAGPRALRCRVRVHALAAG